MKARLALFFALLLCRSAALADFRVLQLDPQHSRVEIEVKTTIDSFVARIEAFQLASTIASDLGGTATADFRFNFADLKTGNTARDAEMSSWEKADKYPDGEFVLGSITRISGGAFTIRGRLRFHGVQRAVSFPAEITSRKNILTVDGETDLDTRDYGLPIYRRFILFSVNPVVHVHFHLVGSLANP